MNRGFAGDEKADQQQDKPPGPPDAELPAKVRQSANVQRRITKDKKYIHEQTANQIRR